MDDAVLVRSLYCRRRALHRFVPASNAVIVEVARRIACHAFAFDNRAPKPVATLHEASLVRGKQRAATVTTDDAILDESAATHAPFELLALAVVRIAPPRAVRWWLSFLHRVARRRRSTDHRDQAARVSSLNRRCRQDEFTSVFAELDDAACRAKSVKGDARHVTPAARSGSVRAQPLEKRQVRAACASAGERSLEQIHRECNAFRPSSTASDSAGENRGCPPRQRPVSCTSHVWLATQDTCHQRDVREPP
jgi:hypothetical protein